MNNFYYAKSGSLSAKIQHTEQLIQAHRQAIKTRITTLEQSINHRLTAPGTLLFAGGIGFISAELTRCNCPKVQTHNGDTVVVAEKSPLLIALELVTSLRSLYLALPITWIVKHILQPSGSSQSSEPPLPETVQARPSQAQHLKQ